jgi:3' terminal RNA ribose 2'-O-methyltransferase Hen1
MNTAFGTALAGRCKDRPELVNEPLALEAHLSAVHSRGGAELIHKLFAPLDYEIEILPVQPSIPIPCSARSPIYSLRLRGHKTVRDLLSHLYVLIPVLDDAKHYFVAADEVKKLVEHGGEWLEKHPAKNLITRRYLAYQQSLVREALSQLTEEAEPDEVAAQAEEDRLEEEATPGMGLHQQRHQAVLAALRLLEGFDAATLIEVIEHVPPR